MQDFFTKRDESQRKGPTRASCSKEQQERYPFVTKMLEGTVNGKGEEETPAFSLALFAAEGEVRFAFTAKGEYGGETWFGSAGPIASILDGIEAAVANGALDRKREKDRGKAKY
jgi:hypothetical protein